MPTPIEQKIMIAGSFDTEKIQMIRELMEEEAIMALTKAGEQWKGDTTTGECIMCKHDSIFFEICTVNEFYEYIKSKK